MSDSELVTVQEPPFMGCIEHRYQDPDSETRRKDITKDSMVFVLKCGLLTPYRDTGRLASEELKFNKVHFATRNKIECTFGLLKGKWRRLKFLDMLDIPCMVKLIFSCTVVHNFAILREGTHLDEFAEEDHLQPPNLDVPTRLAFQKRDMLKMSIQ
ncbi:unnamed protein product [Mytilus coruscus]|uniref:DDE Tnp4 domain-containing protein n=1 Tax=Mytilus coruscus TaxID=42192 RepID=A0A6J8BS97_MYTCO|nr:unnamed protein product [Mytilus coruscus]